jgi:lipoprotein releasing system ATP-binding protein
MSKIILKAENIRKYYPSGRRKLEVLKAVNIEINEGEILSLVGQSGAGKSTLLHVLGGLDKPSEGKVYIKGENIYKLSDSKRAVLRNLHIGFIFQFFHLLPEFSALENVMFPALMSRIKKIRRADAKERARNLISKVGLSSREHHKPSQLSGGEQQRIAIARALMNEPELVLCDEPTGNLDSENSKKLMDLIGKLNKDNNQTFMVVSHDLSVANIGNQVIKIKDGMIVS